MLIGEIHEPAEAPYKSNLPRAYENGIQDRVNKYENASLCVRPRDGKYHFDNGTATRGSRVCESGRAKGVRERGGLRRGAKGAGDDRTTML